MKKLKIKLIKCKKDDIYRYIVYNQLMAVLKKNKHNKYPEEFTDSGISISDINLDKEKISVLDIYNNDYDLLKKIADTKEESSILSFNADYESSIKARKLLDGDKTIVINSIFDKNFLDESSYDLIVGKNVLGDSKSRCQFLHSLNSILKENGEFVILELAFFQPPLSNFRKYFSGKDSSFNKVIFDIKSTVHKLKKYNVKVQIVGKGKNHFIHSDIDLLQEFCDLNGYNEKKREIFLNQIMLVKITGHKKSKH